VKRIGVGIVGIGKIARDQHIPVLRSRTAFALLGCAGGSGKIEGLPVFASVEDMLDGLPELDAIAICAPPQAHYDAAKLALERGKHVLLEKPPCTTLAQLDHLHHLAARCRCTLYQTWHARHAASVEAAERWLEARPVRAGRVVWKEDVRQWHPGQTWIWKAGGFGVLDAGINAVSILTKIIPERIFVETADLDVASNCETPIAAQIVFRTESGAVIDAEFDFRLQGGQDCVVSLDTNAGSMRLAGHGAELTVDGAPVSSSSRNTEYPSLYDRFADLIERGESEVDKRPFQLVADILLAARRRIIEPFVE
jgi:predicted dehydrogenase